jgi:hypothetical protein
MCRRNINPELHTALASHLQNVAWLIEFRIRNLAGPTINRLLAAHKLAGFISVNGHLQAGRRVAVEVDLRDKGVICSEESRIEAAVWCQQRNALRYTVVCKDDSYTSDVRAIIKVRWQIKTASSYAMAACTHYTKLLL